MKPFNIRTAMRILIAAFILAACRGPAARQDQVGEPADLIPVSRDQFRAENMQLGDVTSCNFTRVFRTNGIVTASPQSKADVYSFIPGLVQKVFINPGVHVRKGEKLCILESREFIDLQQEYLESVARLKSVENNYRRSKTLYEQGVASQKDFLAFESEYRMLHARIQALKAQLEILNVNVKDLENGQLSVLLSVRSPVEGFVAAQNCNVGQFVNSGDLLMKVIGNRDLQLHFFVYQEMVGKLKPGQMIDIYSADNPAERYTATINTVGKAIDPDTKSIDCIARPGDKLRDIFIDGMYFQVEVKIDTVTAPGLPTTAIIKSDNKTYILVKEKETSQDLYFKKEAIKTGMVTNGFTQVLSDKPFKDVLIKGTYFFRSN